ncbi:choline/ethanolamine transporter flvcr2a isoform X2 [Anoplolepis gracilipes]|uniref:choline/ethanolamine transporter flvcr2a isoform X2 n=1 Tax=Anoplolepis gracilipes TaxID=354296 RepID=UPI003B9DD12E
MARDNGDIRPSAMSQIPSLPPHLSRNFSDATLPAIHTRAKTTPLVDDSLATLSRLSFSLPFASSFCVSSRPTCGSRVAGEIHRPPELFPRETQVPARLAAVWFGPDQVSSACSIGVFGNQLGIAIGFLFPPMLVPNSDNNCNVERGLRLMFYIVAAITTLVLVLILFFFKSAPPLPPSPAQAVQRENVEKEAFSRSIKRLLTNFGYVLLLFSYGINIAVLYAISTLLNQVVLKYFPGHEEDAGRIGLTIVCTGMLSSVICGVILDKTHKFKQTTLAVYLCCFLGMIIFTLTLNSKIYVVYITAGILGFFITGYLPVGFEFAAELTYPEPEGTAAGLLNAVVQVFGIAFTMLYGFLLGKLGDLWANIAMCIGLGIGTLLTIMIPNDLRRQNAKI